jgi:hypothetical protein
MDNLKNKFTPPMTNAQKDFSKDALTPKMLPSSLGSSP